MSRSLPVVPRSTDPELRRFLEDVRQSVQEVSGAVRTSTDKARQYLTAERLMERFPELLREPSGADGDSVYEAGVYAPGVFAAEGVAASAGVARSMWIHEPVTVTGPVWLDAGARQVGVVYQGGRRVYHNYRSLYAERVV